MSMRNRFFSICLSACSKPKEEYISSKRALSLGSSIRRRYKKYGWEQKKGAKNNPWLDTASTMTTKAEAHSGFEKSKNQPKIEVRLLL